MKFEMTVVSARCFVFDTHDFTVVTTKQCDCVVDDKVHTPTNSVYFKIFQTGENLNESGKCWWLNIFKSCTLPLHETVLKESIRHSSRLRQTQADWGTCLHVIWCNFMPTLTSEDMHDLDLPRAQRAWIKRTEKGCLHTSKHVSYQLEFRWFSLV